jgi:hypothetical protein
MYVVPTGHYLLLTDTLVSTQYQKSLNHRRHLQPITGYLKDI